VALWCVSASPIVEVNLRVRRGRAAQGFASRPVPPFLFASLTIPEFFLARIKEWSGDLLFLYSRLSNHYTEALKISFTPFSSMLFRNLGGNIQRYIMRKILNIILDKVT
jgi:hypothetical protein